MSKSKIRNQILYILLLIPLFKPDSFVQIPLLDTTFNILKIVSALVILFLYISDNSNIDLFILFLALYLVIPLFSALINDGSVYDTANTATIIAFILLAKLLIDKDPMLFFGTFLPVLEMLLYLNLLTIFLFPNGMYSDSVGIGYQRSENWLLGLDNAQLPYYILGIVVSVCRSYYLTKEKRISLRTYALLTVCIVTVLIRWPATAIVSMAVIIASMLFWKLLRHTKVFNIWIYLVVVAAIFVLIVIMQNQQWLSFIVEGILHKSLTFSGRTLIWDRVIDCFLIKPWFGWGVHDSNFVWDHLGQVHAHNLFLQLLFEGGILQLGAFFCFVAVAATKLMKNKKSRQVIFLSAVLFSMLIANQMEPYRSGVWLMVFYIAFRSDKLISTYGGKDKCPVQQVP